MDTTKDKKHISETLTSFIRNCILLLVTRYTMVFLNNQYIKTLITKSNNDQKYILQVMTEENFKTKVHKKLSVKIKRTLIVNKIH